jgi:hypothetical protein
MSKSTLEDHLDNVRDSIVDSMKHAQAVYFVLLAFCTFSVAAMARHHAWTVDNTSALETYRSLQPQEAQTLQALRVLAANPNMTSDQGAPLVPGAIQSEVRVLLREIDRQKPEVRATWLAGKIADQERRVADVSRWQVDALRDKPNARVEPLGDIALGSVGLWAPILVTAVLGYLGALYVELQHRLRTLVAAWPSGGPEVSESLPTNLVTMTLTGSARLRRFAAAAFWGVGPLSLAAMVVLAIGATSARLTLRPRHARFVVGWDAIVIGACFAVCLSVPFLAKWAVNPRSRESSAKATIIQSQPPQEATSSYEATTEALPGEDKLPDEPSG